jgi:predicted RNase H-like HicB family nuclease
LSGRRAATGSSFTRRSRGGGSQLLAIPTLTSPEARSTVYTSKQVGSEGMRYAVVFEPSKYGYGAYVPDLPGCVAAGETIDETERLIREAIEFHIEGMKEDGTKAPEPAAVAQYVDV